MNNRELAAEALDHQERLSLRDHLAATTVQGNSRRDGFLQVDEYGVDRDGIWYPGTEAS